MHSKVHGAQHSTAKHTAYSTNTLLVETSVECNTTQAMLLILKRKKQLIDVKFQCFVNVNVKSACRFVFDCQNRKLQKHDKIVHMLCNFSQNFRNIGDITNYSVYCFQS